MIVKIAPKRQDSQSSFDKLTNYITSEFERDNIDIHTIGFKRLTQYITRESVPDILTGLTVEKTIGIELGNLGSLESAAEQMRGVASENKRVPDPVFHYILSWPSHERPEVKDMLAAARDSIAALGMAEHQYIIAIHANTDNLHAHIELNRIHPKTYKAKHIEWARKTLHLAAREAELKYGWSHDNGLFEVQEVNGQKVIIERSEPRTKKAEGKANLFEIWNGDESLETWCKNAPTQGLKKFLPTFDTWQDLHNFMAVYGIELVDSGGGGMQVRTFAEDGENPVLVSASKAFRFLKRKDLESRFGPFKKAQFLGESQDGTGSPSIADIASNLKKAGDNLRAIGSIDPATQDAIRAYVANLAATTHPTGAGHEQDYAGRSGSINGSEGELNESEHIAAIEHNLNAAERNLRSTEHLDPDFARAARSRRANLTDNLAAAIEQDRPTGQDRSSGGSNRSDGQINYKRDPDKRLLSKAERAGRRRDLYKRFEKEKTIHAVVRSKIMRETRADQKQRLSDSKLAYLANKKKVMQSSMSKVEKQQAIAMLVHQQAVQKDLLTAKAQDEIKVLQKTFKDLPVSSWRSWVEDLAAQGDEAAISALRGMIYQEGRERKKKERGGEGAEDCEIVAPAGATHDPKKAADLRFKLFQGKLFFRFDDGRAAFIDNGETLSWDRALVDDDALRVSLQHAAVKWGNRLTVEGGDAVFQDRLLAMADSLGITIINLERKTPLAAPITPVRRPDPDPVKDIVKPIQIPDEMQIDPVRQELVNTLAKQYPGSTIRSVNTAELQKSDFQGKVVMAKDGYVAQLIEPNTIILHTAISKSASGRMGSKTYKISYKDGVRRMTEVNMRTKNR